MSNQIISIFSIDYNITYNNQYSECWTYSFINNNNDNIYWFFYSPMIIQSFYGHLHKNYHITWRISLVHWDGEFGPWLPGTMTSRHSPLVSGSGVLMHKPQEDLHSGIPRQWPLHTVLQGEANPKIINLHLIQIS